MSDHFANAFHRFSNYIIGHNRFELIDISDSSPTIPDEESIICFKHLLPSITIDSEALKNYWPDHLVIAYSEQTDVVTSFDPAVVNRPELGASSEAAEELHERMKMGCQARKQVDPCEINEDGFKVLAGTIIGKKLEIRFELWESIAKLKGLKLKSGANDTFDFVATKLWKNFLNDGHQWVLQYLLDLITSKHTIETHRWESRLSRPCINYYPYNNKPGKKQALDLAMEVVSRRFVEYCEDLKQSLRCDRTLINEGGKIIVIDDMFKKEGETDQSGFSSALHKVIEHLMPSGWTCEPYNGSWRELVDYLSQYKSLGDSHNKPDKIPNFKKQLKLDKNGAGNVRAILVDQLFRFDSGEKFIGAEVIRGLTRWLRDNKKGVGSPEIIALSRTSHPERIQAALRAGAKDYLLKARVASLPAVLSRVLRGTGDNLDTLHRNMRNLYYLPNETIGLLKSVKVPRIAYQDGTAQYNDKFKKKLSEQIDPILRAIPKTDLHVHMGTCMAPEFIIMASLVGLLRYKWSDFRNIFSDIIKKLINTINPATEKWKIVFKEYLTPSSCIYRVPRGGKDWIVSLGRIFREHIEIQVDYFINEFSNDDPHNSGAIKRYRKFRAAIHSGLKIRDSETLPSVKKLLQTKSNIDLALFALSHSKFFEKPVESADLIRLIILVTSANINPGIKIFDNNSNRHPVSKDYLSAFRGERVGNQWNTAHKTLYPKDHSEWMPDNSKKEGWKISQSFPLQIKNESDEFQLSQNEIDYTCDPISYLLATGTRSNNLVEYLEGCELTGAENLQHPALIQLYARQVLADFVRQGVTYAELRGSPDGYVNEEINLDFFSVCQCLLESFSQAQNELHNKSNRREWVGGVLGSRFSLAHIRSVFNPTTEGGYPHLPCKVSLVLVGKRHKPLSQMIREAAAAAVMRPTQHKGFVSSNEYMNNEFRQCRVVGFDLAGPESDHPPTKFVEEFQRLSRLHISLTVHAGENASSDYVEDAILYLGARRIGHGLSLSEDPELVARVREHRVGIELCPVSNHQTSHFDETGDSDLRAYPLRRYLKDGLMVSLNTDNPIISNTNIIKEYHQASHSLGESGMSLWEMLRIVRMGFQMSFLSSWERRALMEVVGQHLFDLFTDERVLKKLQLITSEQ